jgi:acyl-CoA synthetase (AMP-forming)/AMP-acid ligase II
MCDFSLIFNDYHLCSFKAESKVELHPDLALLLTTSGSTGSPKLVRLSYENLRSNISSIIESLGITQNERAITTLPFNYSYGLSIINTHLAVGASLVLTGDNFFSSDFWRQVRSLGVTSIAGVPYSYEILLKLRFQRMELGELRTLTQAGGRLTLKQAEQINEICTLKGINFYIMYGQTEASPRIAVLSPEYMPQKLGSIGKVISGGSLWIEDVDGNELQSATEVGELIYGGPNVALGYAETGEDLSRGDDWCGILRTGDIAKQDEDGFFYIIGRKHRFLKIFGNRIALDDVEAWFSNQDIVAAAYGVDDHLRVSIESKLDLKLPDIIRGLSEHLSIHQSALDISIINALPRFNSGKVDYQCLNLLS